jgi:hypothetical protein
LKLGATPLYALVSAGAMLVAGVFLALAFRETDRGLDAVLVSALVAFVVQVGAFALARTFARGGQAIAGWGLGALISMGTLVVFGFLGGAVGLPRNVVVLSLATFLFLTELIEPPLLTR